jgi:tripartite-type tricarboxylate transporter receptor subunit TctC
MAARAAADWPSKPVNLVVPFPAGGGTDAFARPFSAQFAKSAGKTLVIDNRGGAGGTLARATRPSWRRTATTSSWAAPTM